MKLSHSTIVSRKSSNKSIRLHNSQKKNISEENIFKDDIIEPIKILIKIQKNDELEPSFVDAFSKIIINNNNFPLYSQSFDNVKTITYSEFYETLKNFGNQINLAKPWKDNNERLLHLKTEQSSRFKKTKSYQNVRKKSVDEMPKADRKNYLFSFEAYNNSIILLLDLSPYMLLYDYSTKSFVLQNMEEIVQNIFVGLERHYNQRKVGTSGPAYFISCYAFSIYKMQIEQVMRDQEIFFSESHQSKFKNKDLISDYICAYINRSKLPHTLYKNQKPMPISQIIQKVLNLQEGHSGIKSFVTISVFKELDSSPYIFFSSNWYTYCFICAGQLNFGSILVDTSEVENKFSKSPYLETKFVFKCIFLQNWEKVQLIQGGEMKLKYLDSSLQKSRAILYISSKGEKKESIFEDLLRFNLKINQKRRKNEAITTNKSESGNPHKNLKILNQYEFNIPLENIAEIMRTKYLQGWQQTPIQNYQKNIKYAFRLQFANGMSIIYNAHKTQDDFKVNISSVLTDMDLANQNQLDNAKNERKWIAEMIKKIDIINTSNFDIITAFKNKNTTQNDNKLKNDRNYKIYLNFDSRGYESMHILNQIITRHDEWNCYFKVRKLYIHFIPSQHYMNELNELLNQFRYFFGERISHLCFMERKKTVDHVRDRENVRWNTIFVKVSGILHFLEIKFGFLKYSDAQIKQVIQNIQNKLSSKKLINGSLKLVPDEIYSYCIEKFVPSSTIRKNLSSIFERNWRINFKNEYLCRVFRHINKKIIKKLGYNFLCYKNQRSFYFKIISVVEKENRKQKGVFLQINYLNTNLIQFKFEAFPSFSFIQNLNNCNISESTSERNIYHITQKSITSSNSQNSISANSLPPISTFSSKQTLAAKPTQNQNQGKYKNSFLELFNILVEQIKQSQKRLVNLIKCQTQIYDSLIRKRIEQNKSGIQDEQLIEKIRLLYGITANNFERQYMSILMQIRKQYYCPQGFQQITKISSGPTKKTATRNVVQSNSSYNPILQISIDQIPEPKNYLMQSPIFNIKGDLILTSKTNPDKKYIFFLLAPNTAAYVWKKPSSQKIYFRLMSNIYSRSLPVEKSQENLKKYFENELIGRIKKQLKQEQYLTFYNLIAEQSQNDQLLLFSLKSKKDQGDQVLSNKYLIKVIQSDLNSFTGININCSHIHAIFSKQENQNLEQRMIKVLLQFKEKFFYYLSIFFEKSNIQMNNQPLNSFSEVSQKKKFSSSQQIFGLQPKMKEKNSEKMQKSLGIRNKTSQQQSNKLFKSLKCNNYYFEKKNVDLDESILTDLNLNNSFNLLTFENIIIKMCTNKGTCFSEDNFLSLFTNKNRKSSEQPQSKQSKIEIHLNFFGYRVSRFSKKIQWLNRILLELVNQCVAYLHVVTVSETNDIKQIENKLRDYIVKGPTQKIPDDIWNQTQIIRQIESGHMKSIIPFHQYSFKPFPAKFIAKQIQIISQSSSKPSQLIYLKYWLTIQITPSRVLKTKVIPFKHISLVTQIIFKMAEGNNYQTQMKIMISNYITQLIKFLKVRNIFKSIESKLNFPENPSIPLFINDKILKKLEEQKRKHSKTKMPKKWHGIQLKSLISSPNQSYLANSEAHTPSSTARQSMQISQQKADSKNYCKLSLIYQESITYFQKFEPYQILSLLACCEKLNAYAIRNLENTYIFFNPELKEYFIFYLQSNGSNIVQPQSANSTHNLSALQRYKSHIEPNQSNKQITTENFRLSSLNLASSLAPIQKEKRKNNSLIYSVYCIDRTVSKANIQKLHGQLIRKAVQEVTFYKIAKTMTINTDNSTNYNPIIIDEPEQEYFREGDKRKLVFQIPYIEQKNNLKQYLKQHIQNSFYHRKTQFRSELKKKQHERVSQLDIIEEVQAKEEKNIAKKKRESKTICNQRCVPQTWIFHTTKTPQLEHLFGNCMFLAQIYMTDRYPSCQNASFWRRHAHKQQKKNSNSKEKLYIYPSLIGSSKNSLQSSKAKQQHLIKHYLQQFNERQFRQQKVGRVSQNFSNPKASKTTISFHLGESNKKKLQSHLNMFQNRADTMAEKHTQKLPEQNQNMTLITIDILSAFGFPKYKVIENFYKQLIYYCLYDYYLENRLFKQLFTNFNLSANNSRKRKSKQKITKDSNDIHTKSMLNGQQSSDGDDELTKSMILSKPLQRHESSPQKHMLSPKQSFVLLSNDDFTNKIYEAYLNIFFTLQKQIPIRRTSCVNMYKTQNKVLIESKIQGIVSFVKNFAQIFKKNSRSNESYAIKLVVYGIEKNVTQIHFWALQYDKIFKLKQDKRCKFTLSFEEVDNDIAKYNLEFTRMGVFFCDSLLDLDSLRQFIFCKQQCITRELKSEKMDQQLQTFNRTDIPSIQYEWMKKVNEGHAFCQADYYLKRSLAIHYEISDQQFLCYCYNFKDKDVQDLFSHLEEMETWYSEKNRLYNFISKIKKNQKKQIIEYQIPPPTIANSIKKYQIGSIYPVKKGKQVNHQQIQINLTKLLKGLVFDQIPFKYFMGSKGSIQKMYKILSYQTICYGNYEEYKGKQTSKLAKIGREYLSILRYEFGAQKISRKDSMSQKQQKEKTGQIKIG